MAQVLRPLVGGLPFVLALLFLTGPAVGRSAADYAAVAFSQSTGHYGYSYGWGSLARAKNEAVANCQGDDAEVVAWVENGYVALALGDTKGVYGWGYGPTKAEAQRFALQNAEKRTTGAYVAVTVYSGD